MGIFSSIAKVTHSRYRRLEKINRFYLERGAQARFEAELLKRINGRKLEVFGEEYFFSPHNPLAHSATVMRWICERYKTAFKYLDRHPPSTILETGCGFGISTWLLSDLTENIVGVDQSAVAIDVASNLFPESQFVCSGIGEYFEMNPDVYFDVIVDCYGGFQREWCETYRSRFGVLIKTGLRPRKKLLTVGQYLRWQYKLKGYQLGFNCTLYDGKTVGIAPTYPLSYLSWSYAHELLHSLRQEKIYPPF